MLAVNKRLLLLLPLFLLACGVVYAPVVAPTTTATVIPIHDTQTPQETTQPCTGVVIAAKSLNLRYEPSTGSAADPDGLRNGDIVTVLDADNGWLYIQIGDRFGWVKSEFVTGCR